MNEFNDKLSVWLDFQRDFFSKNDVQEELLDLPIRLKDNTASGKDLELLSEMCQRFLRLSFVVTKHPKELDKLIHYLDSE